MPTGNEDYAQRSAEWQQREAAARHAALQQRIESVTVEGHKYLPSEYDKLHREHAVTTVSNRLARDVILAAHREASRRGIRIPYLRGEDYLKDTSGDSDEGRAYRDWVRRKLERSGLAQMLPGGEDALPNIFEPMPERWRTIERLNKPRKYQQVVSHLARYLDWYLQPSEDLSPPPFQFMTVLYFLLLLLTFVVPYVGVTVLLMSVGLANYRAKYRAFVRRPHNFYSASSLINSAELYYYLLESYADVEEIPDRSP